MMATTNTTTTTAAAAATLAHGLTSAYASFAAAILDGYDFTTRDLATDLAATTPLSKRHITELTRSIDLARRHNGFAQDLRSGTLTPAHLDGVAQLLSTRLRADAGPEIYSHALDACYEDITQQRTLAEANGHPLTPTHTRALVRAVLARPEYKDSLKETTPPATLSIRRRENGNALLLRGPKSMLDHIETTGQALSEHYLGLVDDTGQSLADHLETQGEDALPPIDTTAKPPKPARNDLWGREAYDEALTAGAAAACIHGLTLGLDYLAGRARITIRRRLTDTTTHRFARHGEYRVILDASTGQPLSGAAELGRALGTPIFAQDIFGNWTISAEAAAAAAALGTCISLSFTHTTQPEPLTSHDPSPALRQWVTDRNGGCMFPGCTRTTGLEFDHIANYHSAFANTCTQTAAENAQMLCTHHHRQKTRGTFRAWTTDGGISINWWNADTGTVSTTISRGILAHTAIDAWEQQHNTPHPSTNRSTPAPTPPTLTAAEADAACRAAAAAFLTAHPAPGIAHAGTTHHITEADLPPTMLDGSDPNAGFAEAHEDPPF